MFIMVVSGLPRNGVSLHPAADLIPCLDIVEAEDIIGLAQIDKGLFQTERKESLERAAG